MPRGAGDVHNAAQSAAALSTPLAAGASGLPLEQPSLHAADHSYSQGASGGAVGASGRYGDAQQAVSEHTVVPLRYKGCSSHTCTVLRMSSTCSLLLDNARAAHVVKLSCCLSFEAYP